MTETAEFVSLESSLAHRSLQLIIMLRISKPLLSVKWQDVLIDMRAIAEHLETRTAKEVAL